MGDEGGPDFGDSLPAVFTPDNEPYLGRHPLHVLDVLIPSALEVHGDIATFTREKGDQLNPLQRSACQLVPQGVNLALTMRELIRQGYLFGTAVLLRPLVERSAIISYLCDHPESVEEWEAGWRHRERPSLRDMLRSLQPDQLEAADEVCQQLNHLVHGDPVGATWNLIHSSDGCLGYGMGRNLNDPQFCDWLCDQTISWLTVLTGRAASLFPHIRALH